MAIAKYKSNLIRAAAISVVMSVMAQGAFGLGFSTVVKDQSSAKYSKCGWESDPHYNKVPLKGKPGKRDNVWIKTDGKDFSIDVPVEVKQMSFLYDSRAKMEGKKLTTTRGNLHFESAGWTNGTNFLKMKKSEAEVNGSITFGVWEKCKQMGSCSLYLEDSKIEATGGILFTMPALYMKASKNRSGAEINLTGNSNITCKSGIILDTILGDMPDIHFKFVFNDKDGKMPFISVKSANINGAEIHINVKGKLKKGIYPLLECTAKNPPQGTLRAITLNGKKISLGTVSAVNGQDITFKIDSADGKHKNDYVLEVK